MVPGTLPKVRVPAFYSSLHFIFLYLPQQPIERSPKNSQLVRPVDWHSHSCLFRQNVFFRKSLRHLLRIAEISLPTAFDDPATFNWVHLGELLLWPTRLLCISEAMEIAEKMPDPIPEEPSIACTYEYKHAAPEYRRNRRWGLVNLSNSIGLCLHCVRLGSAASSYCRMEH